MSSIGSDKEALAVLESDLAIRRLKACDEALARESARIRREREALTRRYNQLRMQRRRLRRAMERQAPLCALLEAAIEELDDKRDRALLRMRYLEGYTTQEICGALAADGQYYGQRHVERLLYEAKCSVLSRLRSGLEKGEEP